MDIGQQEQDGDEHHETLGALVDEGAHLHSLTLDEPARLDTLLMDRSKEHLAHLVDVDKGDRPRHTGCRLFENPLERLVVAIDELDESFSDFEDPLDVLAERLELLSHVRADAPDLRGEGVVRVHPRVVGAKHGRSLQVTHVLAGCDGGRGIGTGHYHRCCVYTRLIYVRQKYR